MLSKSQTLVYKAFVTRLNKIAKERRDTDLSSDELQRVILWTDSLKLVDNCKNVPVEPRYESPSYMNGSQVFEMVTMTPSRKITEPSKESISKAREIRDMSDERIIELAKQMGMKF